MATLPCLVVVLMLGVAGTLADSHDELCDSVQFAVDFYQSTHTEIPNENVIVSPLSVQTALGLVLMGADGQTAEEIVSGLHLKTSDRSTIGSHFKHILDRYNDGGILKIANKVYAKTGYELNPEFNQLAKKQFNSEAENINFADSVNAANNINSWVEDKTNNKIKDLFSSDQLDGDTRMVLVNAVYFKGSWEDPFDRRHTQQDDFWISETESVKVDMMYNMSPVKYGISNELDAKIAMLPYRNSDLSMMVILPNSRTGLSELERRMKTYDFSNVTEHLHQRWTQITMPKFKIESSITLNDVLKRMGMGTMFSDNADFRNLLTSAERLKIDEAVHKAYINVDEEGTEAAAATGMKAVPMSMPPQIRMDHPFFFAIVGPHDVPFVGSVRHF